MSSSFAQNLVPNPSFEDLGGTNPNHWSFDYPWTNDLAGWIYLGGHSGSADYYHANNYWGAYDDDDQTARTGDAYIGMVSHFGANGPGFREYVQVQLTSSLLAGQAYAVEAWVSLKEYTKWGSDGFGFHVTNTAFTGSGNDQTLALTPTVDNATNNYMDDHTGWQLITGVFVATGGEQYLTIGNFRNDANTNYNINSGSGNYSYIFVDDVSLELTVLPCTASAPSSNPTLCVNTPLTPISHTTVGATSIANNGVTGANGLPAGVSASWSGNTIIISGTPTAIGTFNYNILLDCGAVSATGTIVITPLQPGGLCNELVLWLKADAGVTGSAPVTDWDDQSGFNNHTTANNSPVLVSSAINYNPAIDFDGNDEYFETTTTNILLGSQAYTKFAVVVPNNASGSNQTVIGGSASNPHVLKLNSSKVIMRHTTTTLEVSTNLLQDNTPHMMAARYGATETVLTRLDGNEDNAGSPSTPFVDGKTQIGCKTSGNHDWVGYIAEAIEFSNDISNAEIVKVETYLAIKYGLTLDNATGGIAGDYITTTGATIWDADDRPSYHNNIIGIGREDDTDLYQKQSHTIDDSTRIYLNALQTTNAANSGAIGDFSFIMMGDNQGKISATAASNTEIPGTCGLYSRLEREWKVTRKSAGNLFNIDIKLNPNAGPSSINNSNLGLLIDDDGDFSNGGTICYYNGDGSGVFISYTNQTITISNISNSMIPNNSNRYITIGSFNSATPLPVQILSFDAKCNTNKVVLNWSTASEINNDYFTIERSTDAINFNPIALVNGNGTSSELISYSWTDDSKISGRTYYRLKQTDFNGSFEYHGLKSVSCEHETEISIYPNPFENSFKVQLSKNISYPIKVEVIDYLGRNVYSQRIENATTEIFLNEKVTAGTYFLKVFNETTHVVERIVKMK
tara:strand:- start:516 stop:3248 length:2733 start_codon:yes stop_codon:yes gene_type:complete